MVTARLRKRSGKAGFDGALVKVLGKLEGGAKLLPEAGGGAKIGILRVPPGLLKLLLDRELVAAAPERGWALAQPGLRLRERARAPKGSDPYASQNRILAVRRRKLPEGEAAVTVNLAEAPLAWLLMRGKISPRQFDAAEQLRTDFRCANLDPRVTMAWDSPGLGQANRAAPRVLDPTLSQISAKRRVDAAMAAVGAGLNDVLWRVVCAGEGLESAEKALGWPGRSGKLVLGMALGRLADFYGMAGDDEKKTRSA
jgi:hypothetical protein